MFLPYRSYPRAALPRPLPLARTRLFRQDTWLWVFTSGRCYRWFKIPRTPEMTILLQRFYPQLQDLQTYLFVSLLGRTVGFVRAVDGVAFCGMPARP